MGPHAYRKPTPRTDIEPILKCTLDETARWRRRGAEMFEGFRIEGIDGDRRDRNAGARESKQ